MTEGKGRPVPMDADRAPAAPEPSRVLRVFFDWGHPWPLWESGTDEYAMTPSAYGYSAELVDALRQWQEAWVPVADFEMGETQEQPSAEHYERLDLLRRTAFAGILRETPPGIVVRDEID
jgi:hypothetical protein